MSAYDISSSIAYDSAFNTAAIATDTTTNGEIIDTTVGRVLLAEGLPTEVHVQDVNMELASGTIGDVIADVYAKLGACLRSYWIQLRLGSLAHRPRNK